MADEEKKRKKGQVKDLVEKLKKGEITLKEARKELGKRGLLERERWEIIPWAIYFILWLPLNFMFSDQLPAVHFPLVVICISIVLVAFVVYLGIWVTRMHYKRGGLKHDETIILIKDGIYGVMRHTAGFFVIFPICLPIILSEYVPFTPLTVAAIMVMIVSVHYSILLEEKVNDIPKWGDEYLQYMKEVPRYNFILGIWRRAKRKKKGEKIK